mgnify:FL=1
MMNEGMSKQNPENYMDPIWQMHMQTLMKRKRNMEIVQIIDSAIYEYYSEHNLSVPNWKLKKDPQWWIDYLKELETDPKNP